MIPLIYKIDGPLGGVDPTFVILGIVITVGVLGGVAVIARQVHAMTPKQPTPQQRTQAIKAAQSGAQYDQWTERPQQRRDYESQYYSLYGSEPARQGEFVSPRAPGSPPAPTPVGGDVVVTMPSAEPSVVRPAAPPQAGTIPSPWASPSAFEPPGAQAPRMYAPPRPQPGPSDEVVVPGHGRRAREVPLPTGAGAPVDPSRPPFERSSDRPGAAPSVRVDPAFSPRANPLPTSAPPPLPPAPPAPPPMTPSTPRGPPASSGRSTFSKRPEEQAVVGGGGVGLQEGADVTPQRKAIRCPKCSTVFPGPATRPATVKCPACGTTGNLK